MTERAIIFIIIASMVVAVTLILGISAIVKSVMDARTNEANAFVLHTLKSMMDGENDGKEV